ncbi:hypothetical protein BIU82_07335 [Arthrobacter sp. SW1]|uniref:DUF4383 domain-containing protein n=1 Tax=Arthrobacter sp. SW1 TaxID=1920889 RepID=UPI000877D190|nr:DUF4383 domain-containing protein [Arthrobacter sp. SW1]OFI37681.1 hypothetical protein BIU82_07335 [Arthrobacter sp. SW1]
MSSAAAHPHGVHFGRQDIQLAGMGVAVILAAVGVLAFVPGITTQYSQMQFLGPGSHAMFLGLFQVSMLLNLVSLAVGVGGWLMSHTTTGARAFLYGGGALYLAMSVYGLAVGPNSAANFLSVNILDAWTHMVLGILMMTAGWMFSPNQADR